MSVEYAAAETINDKRVSTVQKLKVTAASSTKITELLDGCAQGLM